MAKPMFRADHVGSLLRTPEVKAVRAQADSVVLSSAGYKASDELKSVEDTGIKELVALRKYRS